MEFKNLLSQSASRTIVNVIRDSVFDQINRFDELFDLLYINDIKISWKAAWAIEKIVQVETEFIDIEKFSKLVELTNNCKHDGTRRILLSILLTLQQKSSYEIPTSILNNCFDWFCSSKQPIAIQALALKILIGFSKKYPEMKPELLAYLENYDNYNSTPAMISCVRNSIKYLK